MILQRLVEHYDRLLQDPNAANTLPRLGYSLQKVSFCVVLNADGTLHEFQSLLDQGARGPIPRRLMVPRHTGRSSGIRAQFLCDTAAYMLGYSDKNAATRAEAKFTAFREKHLELKSRIGSAGFHAVCSFLGEWTPSKAVKYTNSLTGIAGSFGVFRLRGEHRFVHDEPAVVEFWDAQELRSDGGPTGMCLVTGSEGRIARLHEPAIKGVKGAHSSGAKLVSFNADSYTSFGKDQSYNAPVSEEASFKYANALNQLLARADRRVLLGDSTVVFWAEQPDPLEIFLSDLLVDAPTQTHPQDAEDRDRAEQLSLFLSQLRGGYAGAEAMDPDTGTRFYVLGLAPNAGTPRIAVRFWVDSSVREMEKRLAQHMDDVSLSGARQYEPPLSVGRLVNATGRAEIDSAKRFKGYDKDSVSPLLAGAIACAVLTGGPYPRALLAAMIERLRTDGVVRHERFAAIKACINRNSRIAGDPREVPVALDRNRTESAYLTGRLFAVLEKVQEDSADGELSATIKDRYFSSASATPAIVFPRLVRLSNHHLAKLRQSHRIYFEKMLGEVMSKIDRFEPFMSLQDQGLFAIGYYHQRQDLFTKKETRGDAQ